MMQCFRSPLQQRLSALITNAALRMGAGTPHPWRAWVQAPILLGALTVGAAAAQDVDTVGQAFADHCFSPYLTAQTAQDTLAPSGARVDFYDLRPFSNTAPSPVTGRAATPGTDRRCEVAFDGEHILKAMEWVNAGLLREGLATRLVNPPATFEQAAGTRALSAVQLNPDRIAVTQIGTRPGPDGIETFINVERLTPLSEGGS